MRFLPRKGNSTKVPNLAGELNPQGHCLNNRCLVSSHFPQEETTELHPTPIPTNATNKASEMELFAPPAATLNPPPINNIMLNAYLNDHRKLSWNINGQGSTQTSVPKYRLRIPKSARQRKHQVPSQVKGMEDWIGIRLPLDKGCSQQGPCTGVRVVVHTVRKSKEDIQTLQYRWNMRRKIIRVGLRTDAWRRTYATQPKPTTAKKYH